MVNAQNIKQITQRDVAMRAGILVQWLKLPAWKFGDRGFEPRSGIQVSKKKKKILRSLVKIQYCGEPP